MSHNDMTRTGLQELHEIYTAMATDLGIIGVVHGIDDSSQQLGQLVTWAGDMNA